MTPIFETSKKLAELISVHLHHAVASELNVGMSEDLRQKFFSYDTAAAEKSALDLEQTIASTPPTTLSDLLTLALIARTKVDNCEDAGADALTLEDLTILAGCLDGMISTLMQGMKDEEAPLLLTYGNRWIWRRSQREGNANG